MTQSSPLIAATEFEICVSMNDLVLWPDESAEIPTHNPRLQAVFEVLGSRIDLLSLHHDYFHNCARAGHGDVHVFEFKENSKNVVAIDLYNEPTDQMDLVYIYIRCTQTASAQIAVLVSEFFCNASAQVSASLQCISTNLRNAIDRKRFPLSVGKTGFMQIQVHHTLGA